MIPVSEEYRRAACAPVRTERLRGKLTLQDTTELDFDDADVMSGSVTLDDACVSGQELQYGCAYLGQATLQLKTSMDRTRLYGAKLQLWYGLQLADGTWEEVPLGVYTVAEAERTSVYVAITGYNALLALDAKLGGTVLRGDAYTIYAAIAAACGLEPAQTEAEVAAFCNAEGDYQLSADDGCTTYRDAIGALAQVLGCFATADGLGRLCLRAFATEPCLTLHPGQRRNATVADYTCHYAALTVEAEDRDFTVCEEDGSGLTLTMGDAPLFEVGLDTRRQSMAEALFAVLNRVDYTPATVQMAGDPTLECGDRIVLTETGEGGSATVQTVVMSRVWKFRGGQTVKAVGANPYLAGAKTKSATTMRKLQTQTSANKLIFYSFSNPAQIHVAEREIPAATMGFTAISDTSAMFLAQLLLKAEPTVQAAEPAEEKPTEEEAAPATAEPLELTVHYYLDNLLLDEFVPCQVLGAGWHTLTLFYPFASVTAATNHRFTVMLQAKGGKVNVPTGALRATITGQGMAGGKTWDGNLNFTESISRWPVGSAKVAFLKLADHCTANLDNPQRGIWADRVGLLAVRANEVAVLGLTERLTMATVVTRWTLTLATVAYNGNYLMNDGTGYTMRTEWCYESTGEPVDSGRLCAVQTRTDDLETVESVVIENE